MSSSGDAPKHQMNVLSTVIYLLGVSILAHCFARRTARENIFSFRNWGQISWPRWLVILVFLDSWLFLFSSGILISGQSMSHSVVACNLAIYSCIFFYGLSKVLIYLFLIEKVYVVWPHRGSRWTSPAYRVCLGIMTGYFVIIVLMVLGKIAYHRDDGQCMIGLKKHVSISLLVYDLFLNFFLTGMFMWPLTRHTFARPTIKRVAARTLVAALAALTTSTVNITVLTILHGIELGWVCLASCGADVTVNAIILFWVTATNPSEGDSTDGPTAVSNRGVNGKLPPSISDPQRMPIKSGQDMSTPSPARLTFSTVPSTTRQSRSFGPIMGNEDEETRHEKVKRFIGRLGNAVGFRNNTNREEERMSVQITVTTTQFEIVEIPGRVTTPREEREEQEEQEEQPTPARPSSSLDRPSLSSGKNPV